MHAIATDWRTANLKHADQALCEFAENLSAKTEHMAPPNLELLRQQGFDDRAIHDATQVIAYFNYITRVADALGVEPEEFIRPWGAGPHP